MSKSTTVHQQDTMRVGEESTLARVDCFVTVMQKVWIDSE